MKAGRSALRALLLACLHCWPGSAAVQADQGSAPLPEYEVKAALMFKIARFVEWPAGSFEHQDDVLTICVLGIDPFGALIDAVEGRPVNGRPVTIRRLVKPSERQQECRIAFIGEVEAARLPAWLAAFANAPVLTIGDTDGFGRSGGTINLLTRDNRVSFEVNVDATERAGLKISAQLLQLATIVHSDS